MSHIVYCPMLLQLDIQTLLPVGFFQLAMILLVMVYYLSNHLGRWRLRDIGSRVSRLHQSWFLFQYRQGSRELVYSRPWLQYISKNGIHSTKTDFDGRRKCNPDNLCTRKQAHKVMG